MSSNNGNNNYNNFTPEQYRMMQQMYNPQMFQQQQIPMNMNYAQMQNSNYITAMPVVFTCKPIVGVKDLDNEQPKYDGTPAFYINYSAGEIYELKLNMNTGLTLKNTYKIQQVQQTPENTENKNTEISKSDFDRLNNTVTLLTDKINNLLGGQNNEHESNANDARNAQHAKSNGNDAKHDGK